MIVGLGRVIGGLGERLEGWKGDWRVRRGTGGLGE